MSVSYESRNCCHVVNELLLLLSFSFGRNLKGVYEQVNALEVTPFKSISTSTLGNRPYPRWINQCPEQLLEAILHYIYHLYKSLEVIEPNQIIYLIQSILRTPTSFSRVNLVWLTLYYGCITALLSRSLKSQWFSGLHRVSNFTQISVTIKAQATKTTTSFICIDKHTQYWKSYV